jgi:hypothetical protein
MRLLRLKIQAWLWMLFYIAFLVLAVNAFSGDAIPLHLLTREAMALYLQHLRGPSSVHRVPCEQPID